MLIFPYSILPIISYFIFNIWFCGIKKNPPQTFVFRGLNVGRFKGFLLPLLLFLLGALPLGGYYQVPSLSEPELDFRLFR